MGYGAVFEISRVAKASRRGLIFMGIGAIGDYLTEVNAAA